MRIEYTVVSIFGDYAVLRTEGAEDTQAALMLLPEEIEEGMKLIFEDMEYRIAD
ncbi:MAG: chorismate--pyruvate lyase [Clostridia bacterium]|nr:chorismate--pyruvate lyase [Clostridia bacterium]